MSEPLRTTVDSWSEGVIEFYEFLRWIFPGFVLLAMLYALLSPLIPGELLGVDPISLTVGTLLGFALRSLGSIGWFQEPPG